MTKGDEAVRRFTTKKDWDCSLRIVAFVRSSCLRSSVQQRQTLVGSVCEKCRVVLYCVWRYDRLRPHQEYPQGRIDKKV